MNLQGRDLRLDLRGDDVRNLQAELIRLGLDVPEDESGQALFGRGTERSIILFQREHGLKPTGVVDTETAKGINDEVDALDFLVEGTVSSPDRVGVGALRLEILDKNIGADLSLADTTTDARGRYRVRFTVPSVDGRPNRKPDLQARAFAGETFLAASEVLYNAENRETLDVTLPANCSALPSEHETLTSALADHYAGRLADLKESADRQDISFLANKTGWDARAVALAALADQLSQEGAGRAGGGLAPAFYYALLRAGVPADADMLYQADVETVETIWRQAVEQGVIARALEREFPAALGMFTSIAAAHALDSRALSGASTLGELLQLALGNDRERQQQFADLYTRERDDPETLWASVRQAFGDETTRRLQLDGQLAYLTANNAPLIERLYEAEQGGGGPFASPLDLAQRGYFRAEKWVPLIDGAVPEQITGATADERRANYAEVLAGQVRIAFPTAVVAELARSGDVPLGVADDLRDAVHAFLTDHQETFEIGSQPIEQYVLRNKLGDQVPTPVREQITRLQRVFQITPTNQAMTALFTNGLDSAHRVVRYDEDEFVQLFKDALGGDEIARLTHAKARQVHNTVRNLALNYLIASTTQGIGAHSKPKFGETKPKNASPVAAHAGDVIAYPTLEGLFGSLDFCACEHCRSLLSPAAYLVDLLMFLDRGDDVWANLLAGWPASHSGAPYPFADQDAWNEFTTDWNTNHPGEPLPNTKISPFDILVERRPDLPRLALTCENTNTPLPYIDVVNETLEYFVTNNLSLSGYLGYNTDERVTAAELLASPQNVSDAAYDALIAERFPAPLPFHRPLEALRRQFDRFGLPLQAVMETLRADDSVERADDASYGWRDILMEELKLSRAEYTLLTDRGLTLQQLYGYDPSTSLDEVLHGRHNVPGKPDTVGISNTKWFARRVRVTHSDLVDILKTSFVNPNAWLIPRLEKLGVPFSTLKALKDGTITDAAFVALLPVGLDATEYGPDIPAWVKDEGNYARIMGLITLANPTDETDLCSFDDVEFRYANPDMSANSLRPIEFVKLARFIRLWKKLGWTVEQTDNVITALYPTTDLPTGTDDAADLEHLDAGFLTLLPRLGFVSQLMPLLHLTPRNLPELLACWSPIDTTGTDSLYRKIFRSPAPAQQDDAFAEDGYGNFKFQQTAYKLLDHAETLRAAFGLTGDEFAQIAADLGFDADTQLSVETLSAVYRRGWLARKLRLSVREFLLLIRFTAFDPFSEPDPPIPPLVRVLRLVEALRAASMKPTQALYLIWNQDLSGKSAPDETQVRSLAQMLRADFADIASQFTLVDDPKGDIARTRMALVYGADATDFFFGLLAPTFSVDVHYAHPKDTLEQPIIEAGGGRIVYDDFRKRLSYLGVLNPDTKNSLQGATGVSDDFKTAVEALYEANQAAIAPFFDRYPELWDAYTAYSAVPPTDPPEKKWTVLLAQLLPELRRRRKRQQALTAIGAATDVESGLVQAVLDDATVLHATADTNVSGLDDFTALETLGLSVQFFWGSTAVGPVGVSEDATAVLVYAPDSEQKLPSNPTAGAPISAVWSGYLQAPESTAYNLRIETDPGATVTLTLEGEGVALAQSDGVWSNLDEISLTAGTLTGVELRVENVNDALTVRWESKGRGREVIPPPHLYSATLIERFRDTYTRFLKAASLASALHLTAGETAYFAASPDDAINGQGWLNALPVSDSPDAQTSQLLRDRLVTLLDFARVKAAIAPDDERLLASLEQPAKTLSSGENPLASLTRDDSLTKLLGRFFGPTGSIDQLGHFDAFRRISDAYAIVKQFGIPAAALVNATTNEPNKQIVDGNTPAGTATGMKVVRNFQSALRARYDPGDWLDAIRPINDELRGLQRDALVAYILQRLGQNPETSHIDTPDKLFEYFLMDVEMDPCMETSRIRHALSSVQLFIERSLMNLEWRVSPAAFKPERWEWMKRYRVWEANRKVFLWPENWLEPELRDDQSPFFKETMSELLQGDITDDAAATALLNYLSKLEQVAKLEPCGIYYAEADSGTEQDVVHVVARTAGAHRKYFYRRYDYSWTPWEQIPLDIEDNPVIPVVWNGRLLLFWLKILKDSPIDPTSQPSPPPRGSTETSIAGRYLGELKQDAFTDASTKAQVAVRALLCWSEYFNGKWQPAKTSNIETPADLGKYSPKGFQRYGFSLGVVPAKDVDSDDPPLRITILFHHGASAQASFLLYNTHSLPVLESGAPPPSTLNLERSRIIWSTGDLHIDYLDSSGAAQFLVGVMHDALTGDAVQPFHPLTHNWDAPFFFSDGRHVFYVTTTEVVATVSQHGGYGVTAKSPTHAIAPVLVPRVIIPDKGGPVMTNPGFGLIDQAAIEPLMKSNGTIFAALATSEAVRYGEVELGPTGEIIPAPAEKA